MAQFDVFLNPEGPGFLVEIQAESFAHFRTTIVVPLDESTRVPVMNDRLNPIFTLAGGEFVLLPQLLFAVPRSILGRASGNLFSEQDRVKAALDMIFFGF